MSGSGKTTSYHGGFLVLGHQDKMFPDQSRVTSQEEDEQNMQFCLGNSRFQPESSPPISAAETSFAAMKTNFLRKIINNMPSKLTSGISSVRRDTFEFDESS